MKSHSVRAWTSRVLTLGASLIVAAAPLALVTSPASAAGSQPTATLAASPASSTYGQSVMLTMTVTAAAGGVTPTGTVNFENGGVTIAGCGSQTLSPVASPALSSAATCATTALPAGTLSLSAVYPGDSNNLTVTATLSYTVAKAGLTVTPNNQSIVYGSAAPASSFYTYTVTGWQNGEGPGTAVGYTAPTCTSTYSNTSPAGTPITITCSSGAATDYTFTYNTATLTVTKYTPPVTFTASPVSSSYGTSVVLTAVVNGDSAAPTGNVTFYYFPSNTTISGCSSVAVITGSPSATQSTATCTVTPDMGAGSNGLVATYNGDGNYVSNSGGPMYYSVSKSTPTVTLATPSPATATYGDSVALSASVAPVGSGATPTGNVTFYANGVAVVGCTNPATVSAGTATCTTTQLPAGSYNLTATYNGNSNYNAATSAGEPMAVAKAATSFSSSSVSGNITYGGTESISVTVQGTSTAPTGTVGFTYGVGSTPISNCNSVSVSSTSGATSTFTCSTTLLPVGNYSIEATYNGDSNYVTYSGVLGSVVVSKAVLTVTPNAQSIVYGTPAPGNAFYTYSVTGFKNGEYPWTALSYVAPTCTSTYVNPTDVGTYSGGITCGGGSAANYSFSNGTATYTVTPAVQAPLSVTSLVGYFGSSLTLTTSGGSGPGSVTFSLVSAGSANCSLNGIVLSATSVGTCTVQATKAASLDYQVASSPVATVQFYVMSLLATQSALVVTTTSGTAGTPLTLATSGGNGTGAVSFSLAGAGSAGCSLSGAVLSASAAGTCSVTASKAGDSSYQPTSSAATTITFAAAPTPPTTTPTPPPAPRAFRVVGVVFTGKRTVVTITGRGFFGQPKITSNARGTRVGVLHDRGTSLTVAVYVSATTPRGMHVLTIRLANGTVLHVRYIQR